MRLYFGICDEEKIDRIGDARLQVSEHMRPDVPMQELTRLPFAFVFVCISIPDLYAIDKPLLLGAEHSPRDLQSLEVVGHCIEADVKHYHRRYSCRRCGCAGGRRDWWQIEFVDLALGARLKRFDYYLYLEEVCRVGTQVPQMIFDVWSIEKSFRSRKLLNIPLRTRNVKICGVVKLCVTYQSDQKRGQSEPDAGRRRVYGHYIDVVQVSA